MTFPTTRRITDFRIEPNNGPPPTPAYENSIALDGTFGGLVVSSGLCVPAVGDTGITRLKEPKQLPCELWIVTQTVSSPSDFMALYISNSDETFFQLLYWIFTEGDPGNSVLALVDVNSNILYTLGGIIAANGAKLGIRVLNTSSLEIWYSINGSTWVKATTLTGLTIPDTIYIGFGIAAVG